ncbi:MAG: hypothetical protein MUF23_02140, partial [Pirellula sp.]|nr:hypothetical protein [Pirellula sp.]
MFRDFLKRVSAAPTNPSVKPSPKEFDIAELYLGPIQVEDADTKDAIPLDEKLRQAYFWIVNHAIISPFYDIEYNEGPHQIFEFGDRG